MADAGLSLLLLDNLKVVQRRLGGVLLHEHVSLEPPWQRNSELVASKLGDGNSKDPVQLFQCSLLGLGDPEENHDECDHVEACVDAESADSASLLEQEGE